MEETIDVSKLEPPEPLERILDALADLKKDQYLRVKHRRDPVPLYRMLRDMEYEWSTTQVAPGRFEILIWPSGTPSPVGNREPSDVKP